MNKYLHSPQLGSSDGQQVMLLNVSAASISLLLTYSLRILNLLFTSSLPILILIVSPTVGLLRRTTSHAAERVLRLQWPLQVRGAGGVAHVPHPRQVCQSAHRGWV